MSGPLCRTLSNKDTLVIENADGSTSRIVLVRRKGKWKVRIWAPKSSKITHGEREKV